MTVPDAVIEKALAAAILAPNSSNTQTWDFYWVQSPKKKAKLVKYCLNQSAARSANQLIVVVADYKLWKRSHKPLIEWVKASRAPKIVLDYYTKLIPFTYRAGFLNLFTPVKVCISFFTGLVRPMMRIPRGTLGLQEVAIKSAALAAENFVLAIAAQDYDSCMMEGFDEWRVKHLLGLSWFSSRVVMVIAVGQSHTRGTWGPQMRLPLEQVVHKV